jgi:hypothetical protein
MQFLRWLVWLSIAVLVAGCTSSSTPVRFPVEKISVPDGSQIYTPEARPEGVVGGRRAQEVEAELVAALSERGYSAVADGALGATASWGLRELHEGRTFGLMAVDSASRYFGFGGVPLFFVPFAPGDSSTWREAVAAIPKNLPLTRYGIRVSPGGHSGAFVLGNMEAKYDSIQRAYDPGQSVTLTGQLDSRYTKAIVFLTKPDGKVDEKELPNRAFSETFQLDAPGSYRVEVMGDSKEGPSIVINLPLYVGMQDSLPRGIGSNVVEPEVAEPRLMELLNQARAAAGVGPVVADAELEALARSHSEDMTGHNFFAHVSPDTGSPGDRLQRAGLLVAQFGENIGLGATPEEIHQGLMDSPGHRKNLLIPGYTHVGIAVEKGDSGLVATFNFARRTPPSEVPTGPAAVDAALRELRTQRGLKPYATDPIYRSVAQAGAEKFASGAETDEANQTMRAVFKREVDRLNSARPAHCTSVFDLLELSQLGEISLLFAVDLGRVGIGAKLREDSKGKRLATVLVFDGPACKEALAPSR